MKRILSRVMLIGLLFSLNAPLMCSEKKIERSWQERTESMRAFFDNVGTVVVEKVKNHYGKLIVGTLGLTATAFILIGLRIKNKFSGNIGRV